jgi:uncharacterized damage-inducible protein DinB
VDMVAHFNRLFAYDIWANRAVVTSLSSIENSPQHSVAFMAHILSAQKLWWERIIGQKQSLPVWPNSTLQNCETQAAELATIWREYLANTNEAALSNAVTYENSQGESWTSTVQDILQHVIMHSVYHRGQIATDMRSAGFIPAYTDFIHAVRQKHIE